MYLTTHQQIKKITIRSPDTDVFILLLKFSKNIKQKLIFDPGTVVTFQDEPLQNSTIS